jgi:hypothetical protein
MRKALWLITGLLSCVLLESCSGISSNTCTIVALITPPTATANHSAPAPGNQVQFSLTSTVKGNCPLVPDQMGSWSTSDPLNTAISNQAPTQGLATCLNATPTLATITNTSTVRGHTFTHATLTCN